MLYRIKISCFWEQIILEMDELNNINCRNSQNIPILKKKHNSQREGKSESIPSNEINFLLSFFPSCLCCIHQDSPEKQNRIYTDIDTRGFINRTRLTWLRRWRSPWHCLQAREPGKPVMQVSLIPKNWGRVEELKAKAQELKSGNLPTELSAKAQESKGWCLMAGKKMDVLTNQAERKGICPSSAFLFYSDPQQIGWCPPTLARATCLTHFMNSNANLFQ